MTIRRLVMVLVGATAVASFALVSPASAVGSVTVTVNIVATHIPAGSVQVESLSTSFGTCNAKASPGTTTCHIVVPGATTVLLVAQPAPTTAWQGWHGACASVPGPVCHLYPTSNTTATVDLGAGGAKPVLTTKSP